MVANKTTLIPVVAIAAALVFSGAGCNVSGGGSEGAKQENDGRIKTEVPLPVFEPPIEAPWLDVPSSNRDFLSRGNFMLEAVPIEFVCDTEFGCSIPMVSMRWSGLGSDSVCIWSLVGGSAAVPWLEVTEDGMHGLSPDLTDNAYVESVLCKDSNGALHYGAADTKILPEG